MTTQQTLRRIDDEITFNRQEIARRQVDIARLEDTRRVLMGLEEADQAAQEARKSGERGLLAGSTGKPILIVRKAGSGANGHHHESTPDAPLGIVSGGKRKGMPRKRKSRSGSKNTGGSAKMRDVILDAIKPGDEPIKSSDLANYLGLAMGEEARKPMQNALYQLRASGKLERDEQKRYFRPAAAVPT